jgi:hypothetical protein
VDKGDRIANAKNGALHCGLFDLDLVAEAKYEAVLSKLEKPTKLSEVK